MAWVVLSGKNKTKVTSRYLPLWMAVSSSIQCRTADGAIDQDFTSHSANCPIQDSLLPQPQSVPELQTVLSPVSYKTTLPPQVASVFIISLEQEGAGPYLKMLSLQDPAGGARGCGLWLQCNLTLAASGLRQDKIRAVNELSYGQYDWKQLMDHDTSLFVLAIGQWTRALCYGRHNGKWTMVNTWKASLGRHNVSTTAEMATWTRGMMTICHVPAHIKTYGGGCFKAPALTLTKAADLALRTIWFMYTESTFKSAKVGWNIAKATELSLKYSDWVMAATQYQICSCLQPHCLTQV